MLHQFLFLSNVCAGTALKRLLSISVYVLLTLQKKFTHDSLRMQVLIIIVYMIFGEKHAHVEN